MKRNILISFCSLISGVCYGQPPSSQSIKWNVTQLTDLKADTVQTYESHFVIDHAVKVVWVQKHREDSFLITSLKEDWSDLGDGGRIEYDIDLQGRSASLLVIRSEVSMEIILAFTNANGRQVEYKFKVESFQVL